VSVDSVTRFWTLFLSIAGAFAVILRFMWLARGKWDETNSTIRGLSATLSTALAQNEAEHARIDRRTDQLDSRLHEHIGRHRRY
jgi:hypothetical protein